MAIRTLAQIRATVQRRVGSSPQITASDLNAIIADVHKDIATAYQWSRRRRETLMNTVAPYSTGTVTVVNGSATITGSGTAWTAAMASVGAGIAISAENSYFFVGAVNVGLQTLALVDAQGTSALWTKASAAGLTYRLFFHQYQLSSSVAIVLGGVRSFPLVEKTRADLDAKDPMRQSTGEPSEFALVRNNLVSGAESVWIEFWPVPDGVYYFRIPFLVDPPDLANNTDLPVCPAEPIEWRASAEAAWFIYTKTGDARWDTLAKSYYQVYAGDEKEGVPGVLMQSLRDDQQRYGLPQVLGGRDAIVGYDRLSTRDWDLL